MEYHQSFSGRTLKVIWTEIEYQLDIFHLVMNLSNLILVMIFITNVGLYAKGLVFEHLFKRFGDKIVCVGSFILKPLCRIWVDALLEIIYLIYSINSI